VRELRGTIPETVLVDLELMVSELVTNAVQHGYHNGAERVHLEVATRRDGVRVAVADHGSGFEPPTAAVAADRPGGRGLLIVDQLADRWGVAANGRTEVWFEMSAR